MTTFPNDADGEGIRRLVEAGSDLSKPMDISFQVAVADEETAIQVADATGALGYRTEIFFDDDLEDVEDNAEPWTCECSRVMLLTYEQIVAAQEELNEIAKPLAGYVDGWSTFGNADG